MVSQRFRITLLTAGFFTLAFCTAHAQAQVKSAAANACITIQQVVPGMAQVDDLGRTTEPVRITINAHGRPEDLKNAEVVYSEDGVPRSTISVGDFHAGVQTVTIPPGLHMTSSSELFDMALVGPDGSETPGLSLPLNGPNAVPPPEPAAPARSASTNNQSEEDTDQPIATIEPGVDREEALSIRRFGPAQVAITSFDGFAKQTSGDDSKLPPQVFTLRGVDFKDGLLVRFSTMKGGQRVEATSPLMHTKIIATLQKPDYTPTNPSALMTATVVVPVKITHDSGKEFLVRAAHAASCQ